MTPRSPSFSEYALPFYPFVDVCVSGPLIAEGGWVVQESLGGNAKTTLLVACSPHVYNVDETISTLDFATRYVPPTRPRAQTPLSLSTSKCLMRCPWISVAVLVWIERKRCS